MRDRLSTAAVLIKEERFATALAARNKRTAASLAKATPGRGIGLKSASRAASVLSTVAPLLPPISVSSVGMRP